MRRTDWRSYIDEDDNFALPQYLFRTLNDLMKQSLDMGTLLSEDPAKLRAYKEQVKKSFKERWLDVAKSLEYFGIIHPCSCNLNDFCEICGGSRYLLDSSLNQTRMEEVSFVRAAGATADVADKLMAGLMRAIEEVERLEAE